MLFLLALAAPAPLQPTSDEPEDSKTGYDWKSAKLDEAFGLDKWKKHKGVSLCGPYAQMCCCGDNGGNGPGGGDLANGQWMGGTISVPMCMPTPPPTEKKGSNSKESDPCGREMKGLYGTAATANWPKEAFQSILGQKYGDKGWLVCHKCSRGELKVATVSDAYKFLSPIGQVGKRVP